ncbi:MAG: glycosyltransferase family 1 protein [Bacteroidia bacterium]
MAHIAVNTRLLLPGRLEGIGRFAYEVLSRMVRQHPDHRYTFFFDRPFDPVYRFGEQVEAVVVPPPARHPLLWMAWFHAQVPRQLTRRRADLFFSPEFYLTNHPRIPQVAVFHDLAYEHAPQDLPPFASWYCRHYSPRYARRAAHLLTVSAWVKQDMVARYGLPADKISVAHNGVSRAFVPVLADEQAAVRAQYSQGQPYFLFVGAVHPRKNLVRLLRAFDQFRSQADAPVKLLLAGRKGWNYREALDTHAQMQYRDEVLFTGYVSDADLSRLYGAALGLVYVSLLEGFGLPILEAMQAGTPVITSDCTAMPEVAGDAALLVDPLDEGAIAQAMLRLWREPVLRQRLVAAGHQQHQRFSWDQTADRVWQVLAQYL